MRLFLAVLFLSSFFLVGCGAPSDGQTTELSEIEEFVNENADELARQEEMMNEIGDEDDDQ